MRLRVQPILLAASLSVPFVSIAQSTPARVIQADVCVFGGTSGGVAAAVQAARMGKSVVLAEPGRHLGGMTAGGLSAVDIGDPRSVGGIAREYFTQLAATAGVTLAWDKAFESKGGGPATGGAYAIEPHKAERLFNQMAREAGVMVHFNARLATVQKSGLRITEFGTEDGTAFRSRMFIDATYEGDLMAKAGVRHTLIREGNAQYGETYNGIHYSEKFQPRTGHLQPGANGRVKGGQGAWDRDFPLDPYVIKGDPLSGLLPLIQAGGPGQSGEAAPGVQAYCFRLCLTTDPANRIPIAPPADYDAKRYEIVARFIEACRANGDDMDLRWFSKYDALPNQKWDFNTATFGGNLPGASHAWPEADYAERSKIAKEHENYHRGLLHFLATDPRVPEKVRNEMRRFGLPKDEFTDNGGWPHQLYIREARRMVSDLVLTEHHTFGRTVAPKSIGLGSYGTDAHEIRRIVKDGVVTREGKIAGGRGGFGPYPIGYDAIVPRRSECENLFVPFALSASHTAFASIRMEPVFMATSQSAATAACLAIDDDVPVQQIDYTKLKTRLLKDGQVLEAQAPVKRPASSSSAGKAPAAKSAARPAGVVLDDTQAEYIGEWIESTRQPALVGAGYRHDNNRGQGTKTARFAPALPAAGEYEVRLLFPATGNRATKVSVTITSADGTKSVIVNQRQDAVVNGVPRPLGVFRFTAGRGGSVTISNADADGYVVVDAVQFVPVEVARAEREGKADSGFARAPAQREARIEPQSPTRSMPAWVAATALSPLAKITAPPRSPERDTERVQLAKDVNPADVDGKTYDLVVIGGTAGGVACAVRAAREGCRVLLVQHNRHIGGMMANGLMQWDALYGGHRAPLFTELLGNIERHYIATFGKDSPDHQRMRYTHEHYPIGWAEPHVAEREFNRLVAGEANIALLLAHYPVAVERDGAMLRSVTLRAYGGAKTIRARAATFVDATYEGDLFALAKVPYRAGREARAEFNEPHAGVVFCNIAKGPAPLDAAEGRLNLHPYSSRQGSIDPTSPFTADRAVQAYNYRFCVTKDPANRLMLTAPPPGYNREEYVRYERKGIATNPGPNQKSHMNSPILPGENHDYPEADWPARERIIARHKNFALGLIWFLQNDESVSAKQRAEFRQWGLPKDEFADHGHIPYEMYVREARRIVGRHVFTEHDNSLAPGLARTPVMPDSIAITDWYMDSHSCTTNSRTGFHYDGKLILTEESRPAQVPYRALLPQGVDNLLVPVCLSATHIAWGAVRLEPVWMQTGEAAGVAAAMAKKKNLPPAQLDADQLVRELCRRRFMVAFFNDVNVRGREPWIPAVEYFGTKGFFADYNARADEPLSEAVREVWQRGVEQLHKGTLDARSQATAVRYAETKVSRATTDTRGAFLLKLWKELEAR